MEHTLEDIRYDKQALEGSIINLLEDFVDKYNVYNLDLNLIPIRLLGERIRFDVEVSVTI